MFLSHLYPIDAAYIQDARENLSKGLSLWLEQSADGHGECLTPPYPSRVNWAKMLIEVQEYEVHTLAVVT